MDGSPTCTGAASQTGVASAAVSEWAHSAILVHPGLPGLSMGAQWLFAFPWFV